MFIVRYRKLFFFISAVAIALSLIVIFTKGLRPSIDFTGGSLVEVSYPNGVPDITQVQNVLKPLNIGARVQAMGNNNLLIRTRTLDETKGEHSVVLNALGSLGAVTESSFDSIGPTIGSELRSRAWMAIVAVVLGIVLFVAFAFRKVSEPVASWKYGIITTVALLHDIIIPAGVFAFLGKEVDTLFVVGLLSVMGLSIHDTIVVFDRIRENLKLKVSHNFSETVGISLRQTFARSINTSLTIVIVLIALLLRGPVSTHDFALLLLIGMTIGTYSSVFIASPLLVEAEAWQKK
ncbi:MAG: protein translocase subunit SecF [Minisyncoccota bacterium]